MEKITAFIPCRLGSTRLGFDKQLSPFAGTTLLDIKVSQLLSSYKINEIILSTDDERIFEKYKNNNKVKVYERDPALLNNTDSNSLIEVMLKHITEGYVLLTFCTTPFFNEYNQIIDFYNNNDCDSVLTARKIGSFVMDGNNILNYKRTDTNDAWPRTQELPLWYELDSAVEPFMHIDIMKECNDRKGNNPAYYLTNALQSIDIDTIDEWNLAEDIYKKLYRNQYEFVGA